MEDFFPIFPQSFLNDSDDFSFFFLIVLFFPGFRHDFLMDFLDVIFEIVLVYL